MQCVLQFVARWPRSTRLDGNIYTNVQNLQQYCVSKYISETRPIILHANTVVFLIWRCETVPILYRGHRSGVFPV